MTSPIAASRELKVILVGNAGVGKTSIARHYCGMSFSYDMTATLGVSHLRKVIQIDGCAVELKLWDTAGSEEYAPLVPLYIRGAHIAIITASVLDGRSIENLPKWKQSVINIEPNCVLLLAINKMDMAEEVDVRDTLTERFQATFPLIFFTSAKTGEEIEGMIGLGAVQAIRERAFVANEQLAPPVPEKKRKRDCC
jgi:small GTP-binding protein